jgi:ABC-type lipoprotein release transport system permease subunit
MSEEQGTRAFSPFEWMVARRYLRARRKEGFISVIAGFSFIGITLGVATLIIVMAVMNGFRQELFNKMLGLNGHVVVHSLTNFSDYDDVAARIPGRGPGHGVDAFDLERRIGAWLARGRPEATQGGFHQHSVRLA